MLSAPLSHSSVGLAACPAAFAAWKNHPRKFAATSEPSDRNGTRGTWYVEGGSELFRSGRFSGGAIVSSEGNAHIEGRVQDFNTHYPVLSLWADTQADRNHRLRLRYDTGIAWVDEEEYLYDHDLTLSGLRYWGSPGETELFVGFFHDDFLFNLRNRKFEDENGNEFESTVNPRRLDRDGPGVRTGFNHYMPLLDDQVIARAGYRFERKWTDGSEYSGLSHLFHVGFLATLPLGFEWDTGTSFEYEPYSNRSIFAIDTEPAPDPENPAETIRVNSNAADDRSRRDRTWYFGTNISKLITENVRISTAYSYTDVDSNVGVYSYERHIVGGYVTVEFQ